MKQYLVTASEMKRYDTNTIEKYRIPSLLLMERAALVTVEELQRTCGMEPCRVLIAAGCGNNGGDGLAVGRLLMLQGYEVTCVLLGSEEQCTQETARQIAILWEYETQIFSTIQNGEYDIVIDAIFGIGLSRAVEGIYKEAIQWINNTKAFVCSVDIASGICADTGEVMGCAVQADLTVTYGFYKIGHMLYPGAGYGGDIVCGQMGIDSRSFLGEEPYWYTCQDQCMLPARSPDGNKGTFGKVMIIAGSEQIAGAAMMAAKSVLRIGAGMVKVVTAESNKESIQQFVPEAMLLTYDENTALCQMLKNVEAWADCILIGPGIGMGKQAQTLLRFAIQESGLPLVIDADGLNLLAQDHALQEAVMEKGAQGRTIVLTPHLGEFARLYGCSVSEAKSHLTGYPVEYADRMHCIVVCKDARSVVVWPGGRQGYLNTTGNAGMATAGAGDVLAGIVTGLLAQNMAGTEAAVTGVYLHGVAGDLAARMKTEVSMMATDIIDQIGNAAAMQTAAGKQGRAGKRL